MKRIRLIHFLFFISFGSFAASASTAGELAVTLAANPGQATAGTKVAVTLTHVGNGATYVYKYATPLALLDNMHLASKMFKVVDLSNKNTEVAYTGSWMRATKLDEQYFIALRNNQSITALYDLRSDYKLIPGHYYRVTYRQDLSGVPTNARGEATSLSIRPSMQDEVLSNALDIYVPEDGGAKGTWTTPSSTASADVPFTTDQQNALAAALIAAQEIASQTISYQSSLYTTT